MDIDVFESEVQSIYTTLFKEIKISEDELNIIIALPIKRATHLSIKYIKRYKTPIRRWPFVVGAAVSLVSGAYALDEEVDGCIYIDDWLKVIGLPNDKMNKRRFFSYQMRMFKTENFNIPCE